MAGVHKKGRVGEDGVTRYYDPHKKLWVTEKQIQDEQEANKIIDLMIIFASVVICGGGFLWMLFVTFSN